MKQSLAVLDITRSGALVEASATARVGTQHLCKFFVDGRAVLLPARVTHTRYRPHVGRSSAHEIGLSFRPISDEDRRAIETLMSWLYERQAAA